MPVVVYIGEKLKQVRTRRLLTQEELADRAGMSAATVVNIERNNQDRSSAPSEKLGKALDVDPTELLGE